MHIRSFSRPALFFIEKIVILTTYLKNTGFNLDWLVQLASEDPLTAQEKVLHHLQEMTAKGTERLRQLLAVDAATKDSAQSLADRYADARRLATEEESRLWAAGHGLHEQLALGYAACLKEVTEKSIPVAEAPALVTRIIYHRGHAARWCHLRYVSIPSGWWLEMHKLFAFAERENFASRPVPIYPDDAPATCAALYLQTLFLETLNRTNMSKRQIENIYHWLLPWAGQITLDKTFREDDQLFFVDLSEDRGGRRIRNFEPTPTCRYWNTDAIVETIERALNSIENGTPQITGIEPEMLHHLHTEWSRTAYKRQRRTDERSDVTKRASVANGIYAVCQEVHSQASGSATLDMDGELWLIENESRYGFGATVSAELNAWLKVGRILALREEMNVGMSVVGVVRSLKHLEEGKVYVGVEVLSHMALYGLSQELHEEIPNPQVFPCIFISSDDERNIPSSILVPAIEYQPDARLRLRLDRKAHGVLLGRLMEQKDDWVRVEVEVVGDIA